MNKNKSEGTFSNKYPRGFLYGLFALTLLMGGVSLYSSNAEVRDVLALATTVKPEKFTELYFEDHLNLPSKVKINQAYSFKFTVHNLENKDMEYPYQVYVEENNKKRFLESKVVKIKINESKTIDEHFSFSQLSSKVFVVVNLTKKDQKIDFWMEGPNLK